MNTEVDRKVLCVHP